MWVLILKLQFDRMGTTKSKKNQKQAACDIFDTLEASDIKHLCPIRTPDSVKWHEIVGTWPTESQLYDWWKKVNRNYSPAVCVGSFFSRLHAAPFIAPWCGHRAIAHYTNYALNERRKKKNHIFALDSKYPVNTWADQNKSEHRHSKTWQKQWAEKSIKGFGINAKCLLCLCVSCFVLFINLYWCKNSFAFEAAVVLTVSQSKTKMNGHFVQIHIKHWP